MNRFVNERFLIQIKRPAFEVFVVAYLSLSYAVHIICPTIRYFIADTHKIDTLIIHSILIVLLLLVVSEAIRRLNQWCILGIIVELIMLSLLMLLSSNNTTFSTVLNRIITQCVPMFFCGACICDYEKIRHGLIKVMTVVPYCYLMMVLMFGLNTLTTNSDYSQQESYTFLLVTIVLTSALFEKFSIKHLIPLIMGLFFMVAYGARGPIVCWIMFVMLQILLQASQERTLKKIGVIAGMGTIGIAIYKNYIGILLWLKELINQFGLSSRVIDGIINASFFEDKGRNTLLDISLEKIHDSFLLGTGPINDRIYIANKLGNVENAAGNYPHNIFIEFLMQYGVVVGILLLLVLVFLLIKTYRILPNKQSKYYLVILIGTYVFPLLFSGSYLDYSGFYLLLATCITIVTNKKKERSNTSGVNYCENS